MSERFICIGDSITEGIGDAQAIGWVGRLNKYLSESKPETWHLNNLGLAGNTSLDVMHRIATEVIPRKPYRLIVSAGINDVVLDLKPTESGPRLGIYHTAYAFEQIIEYTKKFNFKTVILGLPPINEDKFPFIYKKINEDDNGFKINNADIEEREKLIQSICFRNNSHFVPIFSHLIDSEYISFLDDGLHPNTRGYELLFKIIKTKLNEINFFEVD